MNFFQQLRPLNILLLLGHLHKQAVIALVPLHALLLYLQLLLLHSGYKLLSLHREPLQVFLFIFEYLISGHRWTHGTH